MQAIRQFDQDNSNIFGHCQGHFLEVFGLCFCPGLIFHLSQFADAINEIGNGGTELFAKCAFSDTGILDNIMQHRGHQALMIHMHMSENSSYC